MQVTPVIASDGFESVGSLSRKIKPRPGALLASRRPQERNPSIAEDPLKKEEVIRIKERVGLPRRAEVKIVDPEDDVEEASKAKMSSLEKAKTTARLRFRNQLPRRDQEGIKGESRENHGGIMGESWGNQGGIMGEYMGESWGNQ